MSRMHKNVCTPLNYIENFLILAFTSTACISISAFTFFIGIHTGITSSATKLKICAITVGIKKYNSIIKKKKKKHIKIVLLAESKLNSVEVLISTYSVISHDELFLINNELKEYYDMKEKIKNSNNK